MFFDLLEISSSPGRKAILKAFPGHGAMEIIIVTKEQAEEIKREIFAYGYEKIK